MKSVKIILLFILISVLAKGQTEKVFSDSINYAVAIGGNGQPEVAAQILQRLYQKASDDSVRTLTLALQSMYLRRLNFRRAINVNDSSIMLARSSFNTDLIGKIYEIRGDIYHYNSPPHRDLDSARKFYQLSTEYGHDFGNHTQQCIGLLKLCKTYKFAGEQSQLGIEYAMQAIELIEAKLLPLKLVEVYLELSSFYLRKGELYKARQVLLSAINYINVKYPKKGNVYYLQKVNNELALNFLIEEDYQAAYEHVNLVNAEQSKSSYLMGDSYHIRGRIEIGLKNYDRAEEYLKKSSEIFGSVRSTYFQDRNRIYLSQVYLKKGMHRKALEEVSQTLNAANASKVINDLVLSLITRAEVYFEMGDYASCRIDLEEAEKYIGDVANIYVERRLSYDLGQTYSKLKKMEKSNFYLMKYVSLNDKILEENQSMRLSEMESNYELQMRDYKIKDLERDNVIKDLKINRNRAVIISIVGLSIMITFLSILFIRQNRLRSERQVLEMEHELLRSQMNPHFISNSLGAIQSYIFESDKQEAVSYISKFAKLMRLTIEGSREDLISLDKEIKILEYYLALQELRLEDRLNYTFDIHPDITTEDIKVPPMLLQPFVENAVEHGIMNKDDGGWIKVEFSEDEGTIYVRIEDNGIGRNKAREINRQRAGKHVSYATKITAERLDILNGNRLDKIGFEIIDKTLKEHGMLGTIVLFKIPKTWNL
ncbi:MAG: histidine kinase [Flavobacteriales bacterium]|nr:histidine kinase [Flavobacteriales bacterium]